jgi:hypothetical protein
VKFDLSAAPFIVEVTGTDARDIGIVVSRTDEACAFRYDLRK